MICTFRSGTDTVVSMARVDILECLIAGSSCECNLLLRIFTHTVVGVSKSVTLERTNDKRWFGKKKKDLTKDDKVIVRLEVDESTFVLPRELSVLFRPTPDILRQILDKLPKFQNLDPSAVVS